jgi:hypothetical protein
VCFFETVLRDRREGLVDDVPIEALELTQRRYAEITTTADLRLVDLRGDNAVRMGGAGRRPSGTAPEPGTPVVAGISRAFISA